jgi:cyclopropane fatty-acyl-phospholipid synthase-like methyltransferase
VPERDEFIRTYATSGATPLVAAEIEVLGSDYRANGYTTIEQAHRLARLVGLGESDRLLDVGSGCGWPGLYLAEQYGCSVATVDPAHDGIVAGAERADRDGLTARHIAATAEGWALPFRTGSFDAIVHADVLC